MQDLTQRIIGMEQQLTPDERLYYQSLLEQTVSSPDSIRGRRRDNIENTAITTMLVSILGLIVSYISLDRIQEMEMYRKELINLVAYGIPIAAAVAGAVFAWAKNETENQEQIDIMKMNTLYAVQRLLGNTSANSGNEIAH